MLPAKNTLFWVKLKVGIKNMCVNTENCNPKGRRKIKRWCQKESFKHNGRVKSNKSALELQETLHSQKDTFPQPSLIRCLINIPLTSTSISCLSNTVLSHFQVINMTPLHFSVWQEVFSCDLSDLYHKVPKQPKITAWQAKYKIKEPNWSNSRWAFL